MKIVHDSSQTLRLAFRSAARADSGSAPENSPLEEQVVSLFDQLRVPVLRYLMSSRVPVADAEEIVQEVFLLLFQRLRGGRLSENPAGWVFGAAHNFVLKYRDRTRREAGLLRADGGAEGVADSTAGADALMEDAQRQRGLLAVVRALPEQDRQCLHLRAEGLRYREIAEILGMSLGAVANSLQSSLARLARADSR